MFLRSIVRKQRITISVIGGHDANIKEEQLAYNIGKIVAKAGAVLVCGGLKGIMAAACKGAKEERGLTVGILPGKEKMDANAFVDIAIPTSIGYARNAIVACSADIIVALPGSHGTLSEICYGIVFGRPVIDLGNWQKEGMIRVKNLKEAEVKIRQLIKSIESQH